MLYNGNDYGRTGFGIAESSALDEDTEAIHSRALSEKSKSAGIGRAGTVNVGVTHLG
jgi:hypothetical protein